MTFLPPFRADHVGSLLRPKELSAARKEWHEGLITAEQLRSIEDNHILEAVKKTGRDRSQGNKRRRVSA